MKTLPSLGALLEVRGRLAYCLLVTLYFAHLSSACIARQSATKIQERISPVESPSTPPLHLATNSNSTELLVEKKNNSSDESRKKRQLFREDIPKHRPLDGNHYARLHGFPLPGRFSENQQTNNGLQDDGYQIPGGIGSIPVIPGPNLIYEPDLADIYKNLGHGNEIIHQYPVEVSQVIQLDHGIKSEPPKVHPDQNPGPHLFQHQTKPEEPADLVVQEPVGGHGYGGSGGGGHPGGYANNAGPHHPYGVPYYPHPPHRPPPPVPLFYKFPHIFKTWPFVFHKIWPFRRYPPRIKHHHHHNHFP